MADDSTTTTSATTTSLTNASTTVARASTTSQVATTTTQPTTTTTDEPVDPVGEPQTDPLSSPGFPGSAGDIAYLTDVRIGAHEGFERIVLEFDGPVPEYRIEYLESPIVESPSGQEIEVSGDAFLVVTVSPASGVDLSGSEPVETYEGPDRFQPDTTSAIEEAVLTEDFEAVTSWVFGLDGTHSFGAATLGDPARLVIDIRTD